MRISRIEAFVHFCLILSAAILPLFALEMGEYCKANESQSANYEIEDYPVVIFGHCHVSNNAYYVIMAYLSLLSMSLFRTGYEIIDSALKGEYH